MKLEHIRFFFFISVLQKQSNTDALQNTQIEKWAPYIGVLFNTVTQNKWSLYFTCIYWHYPFGNYVKASCNITGSSAATLMI